MRLVVLLIFAVACQRGSAEVRPATAGQRSGMAAFESRRAACDKAWRFEWTLSDVPMGEVHVAASGVVRLDFQDKILLGHAPPSWLACFVGGTRPEVCIPYTMPGMGLGMGLDKPCDLTFAPAPAWNGLDSQAVTASCGSGFVMQLRVVPSLVGVRDALLAAGFIPSADQAASIDGLVVSLGFEGETYYELGEVAGSACTSFAYPPGHRLIAGTEHFQERDKIFPALNDAFEAARKVLMAKVAGIDEQEMAARQERAWARVCLGDRPTYDKAEVDACFAAHPELVKEGSRARVMVMMETYDESTRKERAHFGEALQLIRSEIDEPLCKHFAAR